MVLVDGLTLEESRARRLEKQQSRYRHRFGTFVPAEHNPLLDALLARRVNGESPSPQKPPSRTSLPRKTVKNKRRIPEDDEDDRVESSKKASVPRKRGAGAIAASSNSKQKTVGKGKNPVKTPSLSDNCHQEGAKPTKVSANRKKIARTEDTPVKAVKFSQIHDSDDDVPEPQSIKPPKRGRPKASVKPTKSSKKRLTEEEDDCEPGTHEAEAKKTRTSSRRAATARNKETATEEQPSAEGERTVPKNQSKKRVRPEKNFPASRKRKKTDIEDQTHEKATNPNPGNELNSRFSKENTSKKVSNRPKTKRIALNIPRGTRFSSPLRQPTDDEDDDPLDFLS